MARYSNAIYNEAYYGAGVSKLPGSVEPFFATAVDYDKVLLTWSQAPGAGSDYTAIRVIRNQDQYPETEEDGIIIDEVDLSDIGPQVSVPQSFEDGLQYTAIPLSSGRYVYYGIWIKKSTDIWVEAGAAQALVPKEHSTLGTNSVELVSTHDKFMNLLPRVYTSATQSPIDTVDTSSTLYNFLSSFTFTLDEVLTFIDLLKPDSSGRYMNPNVISAAIDQLGLTQSGARVTKSQKRLIREALYIYSKKGTRKSLETLVESVTGFSPVVTLSPNLVLTSQDSTFNGGIGNWMPVGNCTISLETFVYPPETEALSIDMNYTAKVVVGTAGAKVVNGTYFPITQGIPVVPGVEYGVTFYGKTLSGTGSAKADLKWYDCYGLEITESHTPDSASLSTTWTAGGSSYTAPAKAAYAGIELTFTATGTYYVDMIQVADTTKTNVYNEAREVAIFLQPTKSNFLHNPSFYPTAGTDTLDWKLNGAAPDSSNFVTPSTLSGVHDGSHMLQLTTEPDEAFSINAASSSDMVPSFYTFSIYGQSPDGVETLTLSISIIDSVTSDVLGSKSESIVLGSSWERYQVTVDASDIVDSFRLGVEVGGVSLGNTLNFDAAQLEASYRATDYFDGSVVTTGAVWEGDVDDSFSHQYPNKTVKIPQLVHEVYRNLPINTPFRISMYGSDPITGYTR
jgi:hypothetical protein